MKFFGRIAYSVGYLGFIPVAPGTFGALLAAIILFFLMKFAVYTPLIMIALTAVSSIISILVYPQSVVESGSEDPKTFVIDEFAGMCASLLWLPTLSAPFSTSMVFEVLLVAFVLFRFFDIAKPGPIGWIDKKKGAVPVLADDLLSGVVSCVLLNIYLLLRQGVV